MSEPRIPYFRIVQALTTEPWAITEDMYSLILDRVLNHAETDVRALETQLGRPLDNTGNRVTMRGRTAVIGIEGPLVRYGSVFDSVSGLTSVEFLARDLETALADPKVENVVLNINSPGGQVDGINALSDFIRASQDRKPIYAYVDGLAASAAYWIASATERIVAEEASRVGSIGVIASVLDNSGAQERQGLKRYTIVSSQSPKKGLSVSSADGRSQLQAMVDSAAELFISKVATFRGVTPERVISDFGQGFVVTTGEARKAGMIDGVSPFEGFLKGLSEKAPVVVLGQPAAPAAIHKETVMADTQPNSQPVPAAPPAPVAAAPPIPPPLPAQPDAAAIAAAERARVQLILNSPEAVGREAFARFLAFERPELSAETAVMTLKASPKATPAPAANPLEQAMAQVPNPKVGISAAEVEGTAEEEAGRILAFVPQNRKVKRAS
jgi:signal peptide peptidase SppA